VTAEAFIQRGAEILAAQPFSRLLGVEIGAVAPGRVELRLMMKPELLQQHGFAHGGVLSYLADNALTFAGGTAMASDALTSEYKINYLRPAVGEVLIARAEAVNAGRTQAVCRCEVFAVKDGVEKLCAVAQGTIVKLTQDA
jgi:uncharacterized protein (TIGR00369 family)